MSETIVRIALAGNANVGKSVIFNHLSGLHQHVGNWPGKTVEKAEGTLSFRDYTVDVIDLPGIYSLSTFSLEEKITREYIALEKPDAVINVVDSTVLERNLFFTLQLLELGAPMVVALNQMDLAKDKGITIDCEQLGKILGVAVVPTVAVKGAGIYEVLDEALCAAKEGARPGRIEYGREIEKRVSALELLLSGVNTGYPARFVAIKLLEGDLDIACAVEKVAPAVSSNAREYAAEIERIHGESSPTVVASERYGIASRIVSECQRIISPGKPAFSERLDSVTTHPVLGYVVMAAVLFSVFYSIFTFGGALSAVIGNFFAEFKPASFEAGSASTILWEALVGGFVAGVTLVLPYVFPFYLFLSVLEDSGYLPRIAFLLDRVMHKMGLHGKAIIPLIMGYGCSVPACFSCRILETGRDRLITAFAVTLIPCGARMVVIIALVGAYMGMKWALAVYALDVLIVMALGRIAFKLLPGEPTGLIMEMPSYRMPSAKVVLKQTWNRIKSILYIVFPYYIGGGVLLGVLQVLGVLEPVGKLMTPITVEWLGLPEVSGVLLLFGFVRKELVIVMPAILYGTTNLAEIFTPVQMVVLAVVTMLYIPCMATIVTLLREFGKRKAAFIAVFDTVFAIIIGGILQRLLTLLL